MVYYYISIIIYFSEREMVFICGVGVFSLGYSFVCKVGFFYGRTVDMVRERIYPCFSSVTDVWSGKEV